MRPFEYANPETESEAVELMTSSSGDTALLAGGTDLISLMQRDVLHPDRVVDVKNIESMRGVIPMDDGLRIGALPTLEDLQDHPLTAQHHSLLHVVDGVRAIQIQSMGTVGGDLCHLPNCWYYRNGYGLLAMENGESLVETGDNRYHAIFANQGPAKFVSASRFAPALIAWAGQVRIVGPGPQDEEWVPVEYFFQTPRTDRQGVTVLKAGQLVTHLWVPDARQTRSATYDVMQLEGLDWPLASASVCLDLEGGIVRNARIVLGHVAPVPWVSLAAAEVLVGQPVNPATADLAGQAAVSGASPLSDNEYRVRLARTAVKRAILKATDQLEGGL